MFKTRRLMSWAGFPVVALLLVPVAAQAQDRALWKTDFDNYILHPDSIYTYADADPVPSLEEPAFETVAQAGRWLNDREPIAMVSINGETKAYPIQIMMHHDVANDVVGGTPVAVTFCILCGSAMAYDRRLDGQVLDFGAAGALNNSNLVIYDRQSQTWWGQIIGTGLVGKYAGKKLTPIPAPVMSFRDYRVNYPDGLVLSRETGFDRDYGKGRMTEYESQGPIGRVFTKDVDVRLPVKERVMVLEDGEDIVAIPYTALGERKVITTEVGEKEFVVFWGPGTSSIYAERTADGRDVGAAVAYLPEVDGRHLRFRSTEQAGIFMDRETGSMWTLAGKAVDGPLEGASLRPAEQGVHFWFVWAAYRPQTRVVQR